MRTTSFRVTSGRLLALGALTAVATACPVEPTPDTTPQVNACKVEARAVRTAYAASAIDPALTVFDYLGTGATVYFALEAGPTTHAVTRSPATLGAVSEADCPSLTLAQVPLGSD